METKNIIIPITMEDQQEKIQLQLALLKAIEVISFCADEKNTEDQSTLADTSYWISKLLQNIIEP